MKELIKYFFSVFANIFKTSWQLLINKIRKMILKTLKNVESTFLKYYYIEIRFSTIDNQNNYKLPIIVQLVDYNEAVLLQQNLINGLCDKNFNITSIPNQPKEIVDLDATKTEIINSQQINGFNKIKLILEKLKLENGLYSRYVESELNELQFNINIIGIERIPFENIKNLFVICLNKEVLE